MELKNFRGFLNEELNTDELNDKFKKTFDELREVYPELTISEGTDGLYELDGVNVNIFYGEDSESEFGDGFKVYTLDGDIILDTATYDTNKILKAIEDALKKDKEHEDYT